jgi:hypothetical protein
LALSVPIRGEIARFAQSLAERGRKRCIRARRAGDEVADHRHRLLLRAGGERQGDSSAAENQEIAPIQSFTSS